MRENLINTVLPWGGEDLARNTLSFSYIYFIFNRRVSCFRWGNGFFQS